MTGTQEPDPLETAIDEAVERATAVDALEAASRARTLARLAETDASRATWRGPATGSAWGRWAIATPALAGVLIIVGVLTLAMWPQRLADAPQVARDDRSTPAPEVRPPSQPPGVAAPPVPQVPDGTSMTVAPRQQTAERRRREPMRRAPGGLAAARPDPLAGLIRDLQRLPEEVWERAENTAPPVVPELVPTPPAPIAPLAVETLPESEALTMPPALTSSGENR